MSKPTQPYVLLSIVLVTVGCGSISQSEHEITSPDDAGVVQGDASADPDAYSAAEPDVGTSTDEGWVLYKDADGDGYGDSTGGTMVGWPMAGWSTDGDDCDDSCAACHPGAPEICSVESLDEDCDGVPNDGC